MNIVEKIEKGAEDVVFVYTICGDIEQARSMGYSAIGEKLAISMDYWVIHSVYPWQGIIREVDQYMLMFSTQKSLSEELMKHVQAGHSYKVPMIVRCNTDMSNVPYSLWMDDTLKSEKKLITEIEAHEKHDINSLNKLK
ncbi:MAG: divalent cation tolerance protein CutA [Candidatus Paceibacterota bacterium]